MKRTLSLVVLVLAMVLGVVTLFVPAANAQSSFRIEEVYSNADGSVQYIRLRESAGRDGEHLIGGLVITVTANGVTKSVTIPRDLWWPTTAGAPVQISTVGTPQVCCGSGDVPALPAGLWAAGLDPAVGTGFAMASISDYAILPERFLPMQGGTISLGTVDAITVPALPVNGYEALDREGRRVRAEVHAFARSINPFGLTFPEPPLHEVIPGPVPVREYYHAGLDRYFITSNAAEIDALDSGAQPGWTLEFDAFSALPIVGGVPVANMQPQTLEYAGVPVCRYLLPASLGGAHFYSASAAECAAVAALPGAILESQAAFYAELPDPVTGACRTYPVYRLWNGRADVNHRYTWSTWTREEMIARGWIPEGYGPLGVAFCASGGVWLGPIDEF